MIVEQSVTSSTDECLKDQKIWSLQQCAEIFCESIVKLREKFISVRTSYYLY